MEGAKLDKLSFASLVPDKVYDILGKRKFTLIASILLVALGIGMMGLKRSKAFGIDFNGGDLVTANITGKEINQTMVEESLAGLIVPLEDETGVEIGTKPLGEIVIQEQSSPAGNQKFIQIRGEFGTGFHIEEELKKDLGADLSTNTDVVGPTIGKELATSSGAALLIGLLAILLYVTLRFEFSFALGALVALAHDIIITFGIVVLSGREISLILVGAFLTIAGYSINDTIVVFDRIRERLRSKTGDVTDIMNEAISSTLSRTLITSVTTLIMVVTLYLFGGPSLKDFAFTLIVGVLIGTYSSLFVAAPIVLWWTKLRKEKPPPGSARCRRSRRRSRPGRRRDRMKAYCNTMMCDIGMERSSDAACVSAVDCS